jgi:hypothetical protein
MVYKDMLGDIIGIGSNRIVYNHLHDKNVVIKVQRPKTIKSNNTLHNLIEWNRWNFYKDTEYEILLCPCLEISEDSVYLLQQYAEILYPGKYFKRSRKQWRELPDEIRNYPDSGWYKNWGRLDDRYVLIDYGRENADRVRKRLR